MSNHEPAHAPGHAAAVAAGYEKQDLAVKPILVFTVLLVLANVAVFYGMKKANDAYSAAESDKDRSMHPLAAPHAEPPAPRLQPVPSVEYQAFRAQQDAAVSAYRWIDRTNGVVQIPIERALELVSERGLPHRK
jgi:hypothetical protein